MNNAKQKLLPKFEPIASHPGAPVIQRDASVWTLRLNRPDAHNRLDPLDVDALLTLFTQPFETGNPVALVITGNESRSFSSGYTLDAIMSELDGRFEKMLDALEALPFLTIAAINGNIFGGATDMALSCDIRIGQIGTRLLMPAAGIGLHYYSGGLRRYVTRLGLGTASRLMLTGLPMPAEDLLRVGYLTDLVEADKMPTAVQVYTEAAKLTAPAVVAQMKANMLAIADPMHTDETLADTISGAYHASVKSDELASRVNNMLKKNSKK
ncbi:MAG: enoyl-CoA hydratase/isomerase family protein [Burkholderiaceae bacterium]